MQIEVRSEVRETPRLAQVRGQFDLPEGAGLVTRWEVDLPLGEKPWSVGLVVGPSGSGKSTIARRLWPEAMEVVYHWPVNACVVDGFPESLTTRDVTGLLSSVGFSSPPAWCRPFCTLSNGEQFRATIARAMAEAKERQAGGGLGLVVIDEWTSVVDRQVAQVASHAAAKAIRREKLQLVALSCHYDVIDWLQPDWVFEPATGRFQWRCLRPRPGIECELYRTTAQGWRIFAPHHYLTHTHHKNAQCFVLAVAGRPAAWCSILAFPHPRVPGWRVHRLVTLPEWQGVGLGVAILDRVAAAFAATKPVFLTTSHPALDACCVRSGRWERTRTRSLLTGHHGGKTNMGKTAATERMTSGFRFSGEPNPIDAVMLGVNDLDAGQLVKSRRVPKRERSGGGQI